MKYFTGFYSPYPFWGKIFWPLRQRPNGGREEEEQAEYVVG